MFCRLRVIALQALTALLEPLFAEAAKWGLVSRGARTVKRPICIYDDAKSPSIY